MRQSKSRAAQAQVQTTGAAGKYKHQNEAGIEEMERVSKLPPQEAGDIYEIRMIHTTREHRISHTMGTVISQTFPHKTESRVYLETTERVIEVVESIKAAARPGDGYEIVVNHRRKGIAGEAVLVAEVSRLKIEEKAG